LWVAAKKKKKIDNPTLDNWVKSTKNKLFHFVFDRDWVRIGIGIGSELYWNMLELDWSWIGIGLDLDWNWNGIELELDWNSNWIGIGVGLGTGLDWNWIGI
jgi:hypothetical protein